MGAVVFDPQKIVPICAENSSASCPFTCLSEDVIVKIFGSVFSLREIDSLALTCRSFYRIIKIQSLFFMTFGKADWERNFGDIGEEPPLPSNISQILSSPSPFWPDKTNGETCFLCLVPRYLNGNYLTLKYLGEVIKSPRDKGRATQYKEFRLKLEEYAHKNRWCLITRKVIPHSRTCFYDDRKALVQRCSDASKQNWEFPHLIDATVATVMYYIKTGQRLFGIEPLTYTQCCTEKDRPHMMIVGGFSPDGLCIQGLSPFSGSDGVAPTWKFE